MKLGIVGYGTIVSLALAALARELREPLEAISIYTRPDGHDRARAMLEAIGPSLARSSIVTADIEEFIHRGPALVAEAAGHEALRSIGARVLGAGIDLIITSVGALADNQLLKALDQAAAHSGARHAYIAGAIGGLDILAAAKISGLESVMYTGRKPPNAWQGTRAETLVDLGNLSGPVMFFDDCAGTAARDYPQNANVAATLALAGIGFERTRVRLIADPSITRNVHEISVRAACAQFTLRVEGLAAPDNSRTSLTTAYSLASAILQRVNGNVL